MSKLFLSLVNSIRCDAACSYAAFAFFFQTASTREENVLAGTVTVTQGAVQDVVMTKLN